MYEFLTSIGILLPWIIIVGFFIYSRSKYKNKSGAGAFFFEDDKLVLNTGVPYAIAISDIDHVELDYQAWQVEQRFTYDMTMRVVKKSGGKKRVFYKGHRNAKLATPADMAAVLEEKGIQCFLIDHRK